MSRTPQTNYHDELNHQDYWDNQLPSPHNFNDSAYPSLSRTSIASDPFREPPSVPSHTSYAPVAASEHIPMNRYAQRDQQYAAANASNDEFTPSPWSEKQEPKSRSKIIIWSSVAVAAVLIIAGIVAGVVISKRGSSSSSTKSSSSSSSSSSNPSNFAKDSALKNSFYGFAYTPLGAILPDCGATQDEVIKDVQILSQLTTRIRTYGSDCNVSSLILSAIKQTKVNLTVHLGIYMNDNETVYERQRDLTKQAILDFGADAVDGLTVGNEFILNNLTAISSSDPNSATGLAAAQYLSTKVADVRTMLSGMSLSKDIPVGYADAGGYFNTAILENVDYAMANVHPWFAAVAINDAASWTANYFQTTDVDLAKTTTKNPSFSVAETGWPTNSSTAKDMQNIGGAAASVANLQTFLDTWVCQANANQTAYYFFELFDEPWKTVQFGGVEGYWGILDSDKKLKNITLPDCSHT